MIKDVFKGITAYRHSFRLINQLGLWKFYSIPIIISLLIGISIGFSAWHFADDLGSIISSLWIWEWGAETFAGLSTIMGGLLVLLLGLILYKHLIMAFSAPFMSPVSEKIEAHYFSDIHAHRQSNNISQLWRGIRINSRNLFWELLLTFCLFLLSFVPLLGFITTPLAFLVQAYYAGFGNIDYTLERHFRYNESVDFVKQNRGIAIGNGIVFMACLFIPVVGILIVLPLSVTAASKVTLERLQR